MILLADTCGMIAVYDETHPQSDACNKVLDEAGLVVISPMVLDEIDHIARREFGYEGSVEVAAEIQGHIASGRYVVPQITADTLAGAGQIRRRYAGLQLDLSDAVTMTLAAQHDTADILTVDHRDFRAVAPLSRHQAFRLLPADL